MLVFIRQFLKDFHHTGAVLPSSPRLAQAITRAVRERGVNPRKPRRILEVGPGTGPFTKCLLAALRPGDELHIVEINPAFSRRLEEKFLAPFRAANPDIPVTLHCGPIEAVPLEGTFDHIICGLPFNNFPPRLVRSIFRRLIDLLAEGGELSYFEYAGVRVMKGPLVGTEGRRKLKQIGATGKVLSRRHQGQRELVLGNMPPAVAVRLVRDRAASGA
ncbi:MAG TPA: methyltransferase domain-containing protein [Phycisphaerales bacterium]|nr:methyltransferase domain-containing protein [Phycisphaerales bacterium]